MAKKAGNVRKKAGNVHEIATTKKHLKYGLKPTKNAKMLTLSLLVLVPAFQLVQL